MTEQSITFQSTALSWFISILALLTISILAWLSWKRSGFRRSVFLLESLRVALVGFAVLLLHQPETLREFLPTERPTVAIQVDQSLSMNTRDVGVDQSKTTLTTRATATKALLDSTTWQSLDERLDVVIMPFSRESENKQSDLHAALSAARKEHPNLRAVLLASDGDWNSGRPPVEMATRLRLQKIPVFTVPVGSPTRLPDIHLRSFDVPTFGIAGKSVRIPFSIDSWLPRDHTAQVELKDSTGGKQIQDVRIAAMGRTTDTILWKPTETGDFTLTLSIPTHPDECILDNNERTTPIVIREEKLKVLVIETLPRWEYRYLRNALSRDPGVEVSCLLFHAGLSKVGGGNRDYIKEFPEALEDLAEYDVVFLGDVGIAEGQLTAEQARLLKGLVEQQASGLVFMPGWQGNMHSLVDSPLDALLPVQFDLAQHTGWGSRTPSHFALTELGRRSLLTKLADSQDDNLQVWENLPGFQWYAPVVRAKAGAEVLAVHQEESNEYGRIPLLATRTYGTGKVLFMGTDGAWRWRRGVEDLYHYRFWGQVVRWMAYQRNMAKGSSMRLYFTPEQPEVRQTMTLNANVMEQSGEPLSQGDVTVRIVAPSGRTDTVRMKSTGQEWGAFSGVFTPKEPGAHQMKMQCRQNNSNLEATLFVQGATLEQIGQPARPEVLEEIARVSRGRVLDSGEVEAIVQAISDLPEPAKQVQRLQLWSNPWIAATMISLLGVFWIGRKAVGLV